jgi:hypothetical protein
MPSEWAASISMASDRINSACIGFPPMRCVRDRPSRNSMARKACPPCSSISQMVQMLEWFNATKRCNLTSSAFVDHTHAAAAENFYDAVVRNVLTDQERRAGSETSKAKCKGRFDAKSNYSHRTTIAV